MSTPSQSAGPQKQAALLEVDYDVLIVDLDGTLIKEDVTKMQLISATVRRPWAAPWYAYRFLFDRPRFKAEIAARLVFDPTALTYHQAVIDIVHREKARGRIVALVSASQDLLIQRVAAHTKIFDLALGSRETIIKGPKKLEKMREIFPGKRFVYAGDTFVDLKVWSGCVGAYVVNPSENLLSRVRLLNIPFSVILD